MIPNARTARHALLAVPVVLIGLLLAVPLVLTVVISVFERTGPRIRPGFTFKSYAQFFDGARLVVLERGLLVAAEATLLSLLIAYPIAYFLAMRVRPQLTRTVLLLLTVPFLVNY